MPTGSVLVIDQDAGTQALASAILESEGHRVVATGSSRGALALVDAETPVLVLLLTSNLAIDDLGFARGLARRGAPPLLLLSTSPDGPRWAREIGAVDFVEMPFALDRFISAVRAALPHTGGDTGDPLELR